MSEIELNINEQISELKSFIYNNKELEKLEATLFTMKLLDSSKQPFDFENYFN